MYNLLSQYQSNWRQTDFVVCNIVWHILINFTIFKILFCSLSNPYIRDELSWHNSLNGRSKHSSGYTYLTRSQYRIDLAIKDAILCTETRICLRKRESSEKLVRLNLTRELSIVLSAKIFRTNCLKLLLDIFMADIIIKLKTCRVLFLYYVDDEKSANINENLLSL